ncbi:hypothetical protein SAMN05421852_10511 [Thermoflavimicrobium dichotomicum]|uniref:Uncharacterized protein n=1 Tax=Thermoflavimicrobium dichotomicum TaxID=46223 RepID=A0A1I3NXJ3_9BACL|nr:hypothetical protein SAMN05421852_10511 [Thermoflavimicrobium dichotomicum]
MAFSIKIWFVDQVFVICLSTDPQHYQRDKNGVKSVGMGSLPSDCDGT